MARRRRPVNPEEAARRTISLEIEQMIDTLAKAEGPAADAESVSDAQLVRQWGQRDPLVQDANGLKQTLMTQGLPPEVLDPNSPQCLALLKANPDLAEQWAGILSTPLDERMADLVTPLIEHPLRLGILRPYEDDPESMVRVADSLDAKWGRLLEQQMGGVTSTEQSTNDSPDSSTTPNVMAPALPSSPTSVPPLPGASGQPPTPPPSSTTLPPAIQAPQQMMGG